MTETVPLLSSFISLLSKQNEQNEEEVEGEGEESREREKGTLRAQTLEGLFVTSLSKAPQYG